MHEQKGSDQGLNRLGRASALFSVSSGSLAEILVNRDVRLNKIEEVYIKIRL